MLYKADNWHSPDLLARFFGSVLLFSCCILIQSYVVVQLCPYLVNNRGSFLRMRLYPSVVVV